MYFQSSQVLLFHPLLPHRPELDSNSFSCFLFLFYSNLSCYLKFIVTAAKHCTPKPFPNSVSSSPEVAAMPMFSCFTFRIFDKEVLILSMCPSILGFLPSSIIATLLIL